MGGGKAVERSLDNPPLPMRLARMGHSVLWLNTHISGARWHPAGFRAIDLRDAGIGGGIDFVGGGKAVERSLDNPPLPMRLARMGHPILWPQHPHLRCEMAPGLLADEVISVTDLPGSSRWQYAWER